MQWQSLPPNSWNCHGKETSPFTSYVKILMGDLENRLISGYHKEPFLWLMFIDEIFILWTHGTNELKPFLYHMKLNHFHDGVLWYTHCISRHCSQEIRWWKQLIGWNVYKPTDTHNYWHFNSFHPSHTKCAGPDGQFLREFRNFSLLADYDKHSLILKRNSC